MKKFTIIWTITLVILVSALTIYGFKIKKENINELMEKALVEQSKKYLGLYPGLYPKLDESIRLDYDMLKDSGYDAKLEDDCNGYVIVKTTNAGFEYEGYITCPEYTTKNYSVE